MPLQVITLGEENKILTAADTIWAEIPFKSECRITDPWSEKESGNLFFLKKKKVEEQKKIEKAGSKSFERKNTHKTRKVEKENTVYYLLAAFCKEA